MSEKTYFIVWNADRSEGFVTDDESDAKQCKSGRFRNPSSTAGEAFYETYCDDRRTLQKVVL